MIKINLDVFEELLFRYVVLLRTGTVYSLSSILVMQMSFLLYAKLRPVGQTELQDWYYSKWGGDKTVLIKIKDNPYIDVIFTKQTTCVLGDTLLLFTWYD